MRLGREGYIVLFNGRPMVEVEAVVESKTYRILSESNNREVTVFFNSQAAAAMVTKTVRFYKGRLSRRAFEVFAAFRQMMPSTPKERRA